MFGATLLAMHLRAWLPEHHLTANAENAIKLAAGLVGTMSALVLGLLLASAESQYNADSSETTQMAATVVLLDRMLTGFGSDAVPVRASLRHSMQVMRSGIWPESPSTAVQLEPGSIDGPTIYEGIQTLVPQTEVQRALKPQILEKAIQVAQMRWQLVEQAQMTISTPLLVIVVSWLAIIFFSYGLFAPANGTVITMLMVAALSVSGAMFLILELDSPFGGLIQISSKPMDTAIGHLGQ